MDTAPTPDVTGLLHAWRTGDTDALEELMSVLYDELRRTARHYMQLEREGHTLQTTALVNEAYVRLAGQKAGWQNRAHFMAVAGQVMRRILVDYARQRVAGKRGGARSRSISIGARLALR